LKKNGWFKDDQLRYNTELLENGCVRVYFSNNDKFNYHFLNENRLEVTDILIRHVCFSEMYKLNLNLAVAIPEAHKFIFAVHFS